MDYRKLFIGGCPRSGTTWIERMVASHPGTFTAPESHLHFIVMQASGSPIGLADPAVRDRLLEYFDQGTEEGLHGPHHYCSREDFLKALLEAVEDQDASPVEQAFFATAIILEDFLERTGRDPSLLFVEKSPQNILVAEGFLQLHEGSKLIEVVRDGRDVAVSMEMYHVTDKAIPGDRVSQFETWRHYIEVGRLLKSDPRFEGRVLEVRYDKIRQNPVEELCRMFAFAGLDDSPAGAARIVEACDFKNMKAVGPELHARKGAIGDWRTHFTAEDRALAREMIGEQLDILGYRDWD